MRDNYESFKTNNISILGVSYDSQTNLKDFKEEYDLSFNLLSDDNKVMGNLYDVNSFYFFPQRKTFLINEKGVLVHIINSVNINNHAGDILKIFKNIGGT